MKFAVSILVQSVHETGESRIWEFLVLFIDAADEEDARSKACKIGESYEIEYKNTDEQGVRWKFDSIHQIQMLDPYPPEHGSELFSCFLKDKEARSLMEPIDE